MRKRRRRVAINVPVASMGDIAFLLIIFFMVCSRFAQEAPLEPPKSIDAREVTKGQISVSIDAEGLIYFQGRLMPDASAVEWGVRSMVEGKTAEQARTVMFRCDRSVSKEKFEPVLEAIAKGGGLIAAIGDKVGDEGGQR